MGAAVLWAWLDLYGNAQHSHRFVFVDQAPLQNRAPGWSLGSKGCNDAASLAKLQAALQEDLALFADGNAACCLSQPVPASTAALLKSETLRCSPAMLGAIMAEHTAIDWRPLLPTISAPCLVVCGALSGCFPVEGCTCVAEAVKQGRAVVMAGCNHWCYIEQPQAFADIVNGFHAEL